MNDEKIDQVLDKVDPRRRMLLKKLVLGAGFAIPVVASFSVKELAAAGVGSGGTTLTVTDFFTTIFRTTNTDTTTTTQTTTSLSTTTSTETTTTISLSTTTSTTTETATVTTTFTTILGP